ncbi:MAG: hypothetical protein FDW93_03375 [Bergeyella sp.]|nr:hypothetical protein [Bergeyella sp.]
MRFLSFLSFLFFYAGIYPQKVHDNQKNTVLEKDSVKIFRPSISDYLYKTEHTAYTSIDTTFSFQNGYRFSQYNTRDNFGKIMFANIGSGFQDLIFSVDTKKSLSLIPTNKSYVILGEGDIKYYDVKTPTTSFIYHSAMRSGGVLQSRYTQNVGKNFNFALEYKGLRSQGYYTNSLASNNHTLISARYRSLGGKYSVLGHFLNQNVNNSENGGIRDLSYFVGSDSRFSNRQNIPVNLNDSYSKFLYRRYYFRQSFSPFDEKIPLKIQHTFSYQMNRYSFVIGSGDSAFFREDYVSGLGNSSRKDLNTLKNIVGLSWETSGFLLDIGTQYSTLSLGTSGASVSNINKTRYSESRLGLVGNFRGTLGNWLSLESDFDYSYGSTFGNYFRSYNAAQWNFAKDFSLSGNFLLQTSAPNFNYLINASPVRHLDFQNFNLKNENILNIGGALGFAGFSTKIFTRFYRIDHFTYVDSNVQILQTKTALNIVQTGGESTFNFGKFHLNLRTQFQYNLTQREVYPVPNFIGRSNFFWQSKLFDRAAEIITGVRLYYFSRFSSREYSPVLNEFILPSAKGYEIGGQPIADFYVNLRVKTFQVYLDLQNFSTTFMKNRSYTAPYYPFYDFRVNIGIYWNLFH